jgi:hypothetical protein
MSVDYATVEASYDRCLENDGFYDTFYEKFLAKSEEIPPLFANTDFRSSCPFSAEIGAA